ncbi:hypothetical protein E5288_WYG002590 [Bos mutus]|uniref:Uncharacterized protein n=1 Tax=Bos mutus TaxID=72004 RepID=A0A6B0R3B6_9CETA|nr:hypothetical protein [Bos mutus]
MGRSWSIQQTLRTAAGGATSAEVIPPDSPTIERPKPSFRPGALCRVTECLVSENPQIQFGRRPPDPNGTVHSVLASWGSQLPAPPSLPESVCSEVLWKVFQNQLAGNCFPRAAGVGSPSEWSNFVYCTWPKKDPVGRPYASIPKGRE